MKHGGFGKFTVTAAADDLVNELGYSAEQGWSSAPMIIASFLKCRSRPGGVNFSDARLAGSRLARWLASGGAISKADAC
jgi:hypothetical protein